MIRDRVAIDVKYLAFVAGRSMINVIFIVTQFQEKFQGKVKEHLYFCLLTE